MGRNSAASHVRLRGWRRHRVSVVSWLALSLIAASLVVYAVSSDGYPVHQAKLDDGGVWVVNQDMGGTGRQNVPIGQLDGFFFGGGNQQPQAAPGIDVLQNASAVVSYDEGSSTLMPVDVAMSTGLDDQKVAISGTPVLGGGTLAVVDAQKGRVWASRFDPDAGAPAVSELSREADPVAEVGGAAIGTVTAGGRVLVASRAAGTLTTITPEDDRFGKPAEKPLSPKPTGNLTAITSVADQAVTLDDSGTLAVVGGPAATVPASAALQQPGPDSDQVLVATDGSLLAFSLTDGEETTIASGSGEPSAPVRVGECAYAAWKQDERTARVAWACADDAVQAVEINLQPGAQLVFRVNRNRVVLNDVVNGDVWRFDGKAVDEIADWNAFRPQKKKENREQDQETAADLVEPPQAVDDELGARPGRTTTLHVLDNDKAAGNAILSIVALEGIADDSEVDVTVAPDNQSLLVSVAPEADAGVTTFRYVINDGRSGKAGQATGAVRLSIEPGPSTAAPVLRAGFEKLENPPFSVAAAGSTEIAVLPDWRDPAYGDPVLVESATVPVGNVSVTPDGLLRYEAPLKARGTQTITYQVSTGGSETSTARARVVIAGPTSPPRSPIARDDVASGEVGAPIAVRPLDNDVPGADGIDPEATMRLSGKVAPKGIEVTTDLESGVVTATSNRTGTFFLDYGVTQGSASPGAGRIRVDVRSPSTTNPRPIAAPDTASVRGLSPAVVDVLANDVDPKGGLLTVESAEPATKGTQLKVAVLDGRWLRVSATDVDVRPATQAVRYTITNGSERATGSVTVTQRPALTSDANAPVAITDRATVRAGDTASIPVLDNDSTPSGDPIGLAPAPGKDIVVGELQVLPSVGNAYMSGRRVRYVAPSNIDGPTNVDIQYVVKNTADPAADTDVGTIKVHIVPRTGAPNRFPTPRELQGRVVQGDTVTLKVPPQGADPDGDSVSIVGVGSAPKLGRVVSMGADSLVYQAFPGSAGTDVFEYIVSDPFGATATGTVRVGVVPAGPPQPPVAVDDSVVAAPDRLIEADVLANDLRTPGTRLRIAPLSTNKADVRLLSPQGPIEVRAPAEGGIIEVPYVATNGLTSSSAVLTVESVPNFNNPPTAVNAYTAPEVGSDTVTVNLSDKVMDVDGPESAVSIDKVASRDARVSGMKVTLPVMKDAQVVSYRIVDQDGGVAAAAIYIPPQPRQTPYLRSNAAIRLDPGEKMRVDLSDLVADPEGDPVVLTVKTSLGAVPQGLVDVSAVDKDTIELKAGPRSGPGSVSFEVSDRAKLSDPSASAALLVVPVQVGNPTPVLNCPGTPIEVAAGGNPRTIDVASVCHVYTPDPAEASSLEFEGAWERRPSGVTLTNTEDGITLVASSGVARENGVMRVAVAGAQASAKLLVAVVPLPPPSLTPIIKDADSGQPVTIDFARDYLVSDVGEDEREVVVLEANPLQGVDASITREGSKLTITPGKDQYGTMRFQVEVSDVGTAAAKRPPATGIVQLNVRARPEAPQALISASEMLSNTVALTWRPSKSNGARIQRYEVRYDGKKGGGNFTCAGPPCRVTGLENGAPYTFKVRAQNSVGWSDYSNTAVGFPDEITGPVRDLRVTQQRDKRVTLEWAAPADCECSKIQKIVLSWPGGARTLAPGARGYEIGGLPNGDEFTFEVRAYNAKGVRDNIATVASVQGMASGAPDAPSAPTFSTQERGDNTKVVTLSWASVGANGGDPVEYQVLRSGSRKPVCAWQTTRTCSDDLQNTGATYNYTVQARNAEEVGDPGFHMSKTSLSTEVEAAFTPDAVVIDQLYATGKEESATARDGRVYIEFTTGNSRGTVNLVKCTYNGMQPCGEWKLGREGGVVRDFINLPKGQQSDVVLQACNGSKGGAGTGNECGPSDSDTVTAYGPIGEARLTAVKAGRNSPNVNWTISWDGNGKAVNVALERNGTPIKSWGATMSGSESGQDNIGWGASATYKLVISDTPPAKAGETARQPKTEVVPDVATDNPNPTLSVGKGAKGTTSYCRSTTYCARIVVNIAGMEPNQSYTIWYSTDCNTPSRSQCLDTQGGASRYAQERITTNNNGDLVNGGSRYFGYPGAKVWVDVDAFDRNFQSNRLPW